MKLPLQWLPGETAAGSFPRVPVFWRELDSSPDRPPSPSPSAGFWPPEMSVGLESLSPGFSAGRVAAPIPSFLPGPVTILTPPQGGGLQCLSCKLLGNCSVPPEEVMWLREKRCVFLWVAKDTETWPGNLADRTPSLNSEHC